MSFLKTDGTIWGVGWNDNGQIGDGTTIAKSSPVQAGSATNWIALETSTYATRGIASV